MCFLCPVLLPPIFRTFTVAERRTSGLAFRNLQILRCRKQLYLSDLVNRYSDHKFSSVFSHFSGYGQVKSIKKPQNRLFVPSSIQLQNAYGLAKKVTGMRIVVSEEIWLLAFWDCIKIFSHVFSVVKCRGEGVKMDKMDKMAMHSIRIRSSKIFSLTRKFCCFFSYLSLGWRHC